MNFVSNRSKSSSTDVELLGLYRSTGKLEYLADLYQPYMELVYGVCLQYFRDVERSKDAVMSIFEELIEKLQKHEVQNFKSWLHTVARNHCLMHLRSPQNKPFAEWSESVVQSEDFWHLDGINDKEEALTRIEHCLGELSKDQKLAVTLFYLEQKCYNEIALETGIEWNKLRSHIQNGRRNLKICMEKAEA